jgi:predicted phosphate transport protein (TIGR00153 family)
MGVIDRFFAPSPFIGLQEHAKKVHSKTEHEADQIKTSMRDSISKMYFLSVGRLELSQFLGYQDDVADAAEDFAVVVLIRKTKLPEELKSDFMTFVEQVIRVSEDLMELTNKLSTLAEAAFAGEEAEEMLKSIAKIGEEEWQADRLERKFARHLYNIEDKLDPVTIMFLDKYCQTLGRVSNNAEKTAKYLRLIIRKK